MRCRGGATRDDADRDGRGTARVGDDESVDAIARTVSLRPRDRNSVAAGSQ